ncbi:chaperone NapD [Helicobacter sp. MIT 21-1697]|uniref:chaperone NapD n=1 Tax=Helicobacter sp. MIT 21-1697 TaxID=2993733 RepID=UPI00224A6AB6|nr:chaperone NapD [Helicobacter sp. MIT 21-1697]MCX2717544.1 chaperone NapD [Helicobacter sp. MIT 21-1697]
MNISSIVVKTTQDSFNCVKNTIMQIQGCEIYLEDEATHQLIVVVEAPSTEEEVAINKHIESIAGVMSANMHYTYQEDEINAQLKNIDGSISEFLNNDNIPAENIAYSGSVAHLMSKKRKK